MDVSKEELDLMNESIWKMEKENNDQNRVLRTTILSFFKRNSNKVRPREVK